MLTIVYIKPVSYTHLDVYKRQELMYVGLNVPQLVGDYDAKMWVLRKIL